MPELPEVEHLRRSLEPVLVGARIGRVQLRRSDVLRIENRRLTSIAGRAAAAHLLGGGRIVRLERWGKQLAFISDDDRTLCAHLGMSGQILFLARGERLPRQDHVHCIWSVDSGRLIFRDPRRFGGLWAYPTFHRLYTARWHNLGPDALMIRPAQLAEACGRSARPIKALLLDQTAVAGIGNIYADEALFAARIHPARPACSLTPDATRHLVRALHRTLTRAVESGGSSLRDYVDGRGEPGRFARLHCVYGRGGLPCGRCGRLLRRTTIGQRTTTYCQGCQPNG